MGLTPLREAADAYAAAEVQKGKENPHRKAHEAARFRNAFMAGALWEARRYNQELKERMERDDQRRREPTH